MTRLPPALAATSTPRVLELLGEPAPGATVLELGFAGIHAVPLRLAGWDVTVVEPDPAFRERARQRAGEVLTAVPERSFDVAVVAEPVAGHVCAGHVVVVHLDGTASLLG